METGRKAIHYALGDNQDYECEWSKAVLEYLENGYSSEDSKSEVEVGDTTYKILKREKVTAFYDADGMKAIAAVPSREELLSKFLGSIQSPITNLARVLNQIAEKGGAGEATAAVETEAAEEAPATEEA